MKKLLTLTLTLILSLGVMAMTACGGGGGGLGDLFGKSEFEKMFDKVSENCTIESTGVYSGYYVYKFTEDKVEITEPVEGYLGTKWWDATDTSDYVLLERSYNTDFDIEVEHKEKSYYVSGRKDSFNAAFGFIAEHEDKLTKTEEGNYVGETIVHGSITYNDIIIYVEEGKIVFAEYDLTTNGGTVHFEVEVGNTSITLPEYQRN